RVVYIKLGHGNLVQWSFFDTEEEAVCSQVQKLAELLWSSFMLRVVTGNPQTLPPCPTRGGVALCGVT
ncbi:hypothetical protein Celaphus_00007005, partial [Cervus elaphus hippelaphus]